MIMGTRYDEGDVVYYLWDSLIFETIVKNVVVKGDKNAYFIYYDIEYCSQGNGNGKLIKEKVPEQCLFPSVDLIFDFMRKNMHKYEK